VELEKTILRKVGEAISRYRMIRNGDRVAVGSDPYARDRRALAALD